MGWNRRLFHNRKRNWKFSVCYSYFITDNLDFWKKIEKTIIFFFYLFVLLPKFLERVYMQKHIKYCTSIAFKTAHSKYTFIGR